MIGYAPFLGQVRLISRELGQAEVEIPANEVLGLDTTIRSIILSAPQCVKASGQVMEGIGFKMGRATRDGTSAMLTQEEMAVIRDMQSCWSAWIAAPAKPPTVVTPTAEGLPTWGYVVGGVAALGLIALVATR
jgi:hypothetical protein